VRAFFADMLGFDGFDTLAKDTTLYPKFTVTTAAEVQEQTLRTLVRVMLQENSDYRDIFTTRETFLTPLLGSLYGVPVLSPDGLPTTWVPYEFAPPSGQSGILTVNEREIPSRPPGESGPRL
jgi:hypothetical protein